MFSDPQSRTLQSSLALADPPKQPQALTEKHRPKLLAEMVGQGYAVGELQEFCASPYPQAFLFYGATGVGKTTAAFAMARELGINFDWNLKWVKSGELNDETVSDGIKLLRQVAINDGYKMIVCDEADKMSSKAKDRYLSILEALQEGEYGKSIIIFTTNNAESMEQRFRDRCAPIEFLSAPSVIGQDAQVLLYRLWTAEGLEGTPPPIDRIPGLISREGDKPALSFRRVVRFVEQECRKPRKPVVKADPRTVKVQGRVAL